jgi:hypothetical protein
MPGRRLGETPRENRARRRSRFDALCDGGALGEDWFAAVARRLNIAKHGGSTGLAAIGREARGLGVGEGWPALGSALTETSHGK